MEDASSGTHHVESKEMSDLAYAVETSTRRAALTNAKQNRKLRSFA
jgi:hypothetical protein